MLSPIVIFAFNRPDSLAKLIESLKRNPGWDLHDIYVFVDGPRDSVDVPKVYEVVKIARQLTERVFASEENKGLGESVIQGVLQVVKEYGRVIVLEDDLVLMPGFLSFMNNALERLESDNRIFSICGYGLKIKKPKDYEGAVYLSNRSSSWGWGTWADRWNSVDWNVADWEGLQSSRKLQRDFNRAGSDMYSMLKGYMEGKNRSWAIRFCYAQFRQNRYSVHPFRSLVTNEGFGTSATNCRQKYSRFKTDLDITGYQQITPPRGVLAFGCSIAA